MGLDSDPADVKQKKSVLFVCLGNICRSPTAEAVFRSVVEKSGRANEFEIDSCGTGGGNPDWYVERGWSYHEGDQADARMRQHAGARGVTLTSRSRPLKPQDLATFDYIVAMDMKNVRDIQTAAEYWAAKQGVPGNYKEKISLMSDFIRNEQYKRYNEVPDPYFGGAAGFELVLDLLEDACTGLLDTIDKQC